MSRWEQPAHPLYEVLLYMVRHPPPEFTKGKMFISELTEEENTRLQDWCSRHVKPEWLTGIGVMDAADSQIREAVANGNIADVTAPKLKSVSRKIRPKKKPCPCPECLGQGRGLDLGFGDQVPTCEKCGGTGINAG